MITNIVHIFFQLLFAYFSINILYLLIASITGRFFTKPTVPQSDELKKIAVLITTLRQDEVVLNTTRSAVLHDYDKNYFQVFVAADQLRSDTIDALRKIGATVFEVHFERGSKARSLNFLLNKIDANAFDIAFVLDEDNIMQPGVMKQVNNAFVHGARAVQSHRMAKNTNNSIAVLDAISEEINNHLFRKAQQNLGLSASTIGSGMAFEFWRLKEVYNKPGILDNPACDREVDFEMMKQDVIVEYLDQAHVLDEKVAKTDVFERQRRRWLESQIIHLRLFFSKNERVAHKTKNYWNKLFINLIPPRLLFLGALCLVILAIFVGYLNNLNISGLPYKAWLLLFFVYLLALILSVPNRYFNFQTVKAFLSLPGLLLSFARAGIGLKPGRKEFVHTPKSVTGEKGPQA